MTRLRLLFTPFVDVKPAAANADGAGWLTMKVNVFQMFADDWHRYGPATALHNLLFIAGGIIKDGEMPCVGDPE